MKKVLSILMALMMAVGLLAACGTSAPPADTGTPAPAGGSSAAADPAEAAEDPVPLKLIVRKLGEASIENPIQPIIEEKVNVKLEIDFRAPSDYGQQCQVILASRDYPDMMEVWWQNPPGDFDDFAMSGEFLALDDLLAEHGQNILAIRPDASWWKAPDGKIYGLPCRYAEMADMSIMIRQDWLDALDLEMPTTLEQVEEVARAFTFEDPDGNGQDDTYGFGQGKDYGLTWDIYFGAYGVRRGQWNEVDGELVWWGVRPEALEAAKLFRAVYQEGLVEPEFTLLARSEYLNRLNTDKYGIFWHQPTPMTPETSDIWREYVTNVPQAVNAVLPPIANPDGTDPAYEGVAEQQFIHQVIFKDAERPDKCVQLLDFLASDEGTELVTFGIEGEHWDDVDGKVVTREMTPDEMKDTGIGLYAWMMRQKYYPRNTGELAMEAITTYTPYIVRNPMAYQTEPEQKYGPTLKTDYTTSIFTQLVVDKNIDPDALWAEYVQTWDTTGGAEMTEAVNAEYKMLQSK